MIIILFFIFIFFIFLVFWAGKKNKKIQSNLNDLTIIGDTVNLKEYVIPAEHVKSLLIHLDQNSFYDLKQQIGFSSSKAAELIDFSNQNQWRSLIVDFGEVYDDKGEEDIRFLPVTLSIKDSKTEFNRVYSLGIYLHQDEVYKVELDDNWTNELEENLEVVYQDFLKNVKNLLSQGWKNYYYPHQVRYAGESETKLLKEQKQAIFHQNQILSFEQFKECFDKKDSGIEFCLYLDNVVINFLYTILGYSVLTEIQRFSSLNFHQYNDLIQAVGLDEDEFERGEEAFKKYMSKAVLVRQQAEQKAISQGYLIDEQYVDPIS